MKVWAGGKRKDGGRRAIEGFKYLGEGAAEGSGGQPGTDHPCALVLTLAQGSEEGRKRMSTPAQTGSHTI